MKQFFLPTWACDVDMQYTGTSKLIANGEAVYFSSELQGQLNSHDFFPWERELAKVNTPWGPCAYLISPTLYEAISVHKWHD